MINEIITLLPPRIAERLSGIDMSQVSEIRLVTDRPLTLTVKDKAVPVGISVSAEEMSLTVAALCRGSLHSFEDTIRQGYIPLGNGARAGVCGVMSGGAVMTVTSLCIRIPRSVYGVGQSLVRRLLTVPSGMLIYSPPGVGKTTLLRDVASILSSPPYFKRVSVIDERNEIFRPDAFTLSCADVYSSYPKNEAIELAVRTMSPQYLICDELGQRDAEVLLSTQSLGVPTVATVHAPSLEALMRRKIFKELDTCGLFSLYIGLSRDGRGFSFRVDEGGGIC